MNCLTLLALLALFVCVASSSSCLTATNNAAVYTFPAGNADCSTGSGSAALNSPAGISFYSENRLFIADVGNSRVVLLDTSSNEFLAVFGQPDFTSNNASVSQTGLDQPRGVYAETKTGRLWVADYLNNRVVWYNNAASATGGNHAADGVIGQTSFDNYTAATSRAGLTLPNAVFVDEESQTLYVSDGGNNRTLYYQRYLKRTFGKNAKGAIGTNSRLDFNNVGSFLGSPFGLFVDVYSRLYISDRYNNRVLRYDAPQDNRPSVVFGQASIGTSARSNSSETNGLNQPIYVVYDAANDVLFVSDYRNNRIVGYPSALSQESNGPTATIFIGQTSTTSREAGCGSSSLDRAWGLAIQPTTNQLFTAEFGNSVVLGFCADTSNSVQPTPSFAFASATAAASSTIVNTTTGASTGSSSTGSSSTGSSSTGSSSTGSSSTGSKTTGSRTGGSTGSRTTGVRRI